MKLVHFILIIATSVLVCFGQENDLAAFKELNTKVVNAIRTNDFRSAEEMATQLIALSTKINGVASRNTAIATMNLAYAQKQQNKFDAAIRNFQTAIAHLEKMDNLKKTDLINAYEGLAHTYFLNDKSKLAVQAYLTAILSADKNFGFESKEGYSAALSIAMIYLKDKDYSTANDFFIKSYGRALKHYGMSSPEVEKVENIRACSAVTTKISQNQNNAFNDVRKNFINSAGGGILNGKALSLPKPSYPLLAKKLGISGTVAVRVKINEAGSVFNITPVCGDPLLKSAAAAAASGAKFSPTILDGKPVIVSGLITYNFVH